MKTRIYAATAVKGLKEILYCVRKPDSDGGRGTNYKQMCNGWKAWSCVIMVIVDLICHNVKFRSTKYCIEYELKKWHDISSSSYRSRTLWINNIYVHTAIKLGLHGVFPANTRRWPMSAWYWPNVCDAGPTSGRHWVNISCLLGWKQYSLLVSPTWRLNFPISWLPPLSPCWPCWWFVKCFRLTLDRWPPPPPPRPHFQKYLDS